MLRSDGRIDQENAQSDQEMGDSKITSRLDQECVLEQEKTEMASRFELLKEEIKNVKEKLREKEEKLTEDGKAHSLKVVKFAMNTNCMLILFCISRSSNFHQIVG